MKDITDVIELATTEPEEAAKNVDRARMFDMHPTEYKDVAQELNTEAESLELVTDKATSGVNDYMRQSDQHASLVKKDVEALNYMDKFTKEFHVQTGVREPSALKEGEEESYIERYGSFAKSRIFDIPSNQREINEIIEKNFTGEEITEHDKLTLESLSDESDDLLQEDFGIDGSLETLPIDIIAGLGEMWRGATDNKALIGTIVGGQALAGAVITSPVPVPGARVVGAIAGATTGAVNAAMAVGFFDGYKQMRNSVFHELSRATKTVDDVKVPLDIDHDTKLAVSVGVGLISGVTAGAVGRVILKKNPFMQKFASPKMIVGMLNNPTRMAQIKILGNIVKSIGAGTAGGGIAEFARVFGVELAKTDGSEASFDNLLGRIATVENAKRVGRAAVVGGGAAGLISTALNAPQYKGLKTRYNNAVAKATRGLGKDETIVVRDDGSMTIEKIKPSKETRQSTEPAKIPTDLPDIPSDNQTLNKVVKVLSVQDTINNMAKVATATEVNKFAPAEMSVIRKKLFSAAGITDEVWVYLDDMEKFANDPEKGKAVMDAIDPTGSLAAMDKAVPIKAPLTTMLPIIEKYPEFSDYLRHAPQEMNPKEGKNYYKQLEAAKKGRQELHESLGTEGEMTSEQKSQLDTALNPLLEAKESFTDHDHYIRPTFTEVIESGLPQAKVDKFNNAQTDARIAVHKMLIDENTIKFEKIEDRIVRDVEGKDITEEIKMLSRELTVLDSFLDTKNTSEASKAITLKHKKKNYSASAIDPETLPFDPETIEAFLGDPNIKKRKVFVKGGISLEESAAINGLESGVELLQILVSTPTRKQVTQHREQRKLELRNRVQQTIKPAKLDAQAKVLDNQTKVHLKEMKFMASERTGSFVDGFKVIALPIPTSGELNAIAVGIIRKTLVGDINHNKYAVAERKHQKAAVKHYAKNEIEQAFKSKENAALNVELIKESLKAQALIKKNNKFLKKLKKPAVIQELKDAKMFEAIDEILQVYKIDTSRRGVAKRGQYNRLVKKLVAQNRGDFKVPDKYNEVRENMSEMTMDQYEAITNLAKGILHQARIENKLFKAIEKMKMVQTVEAAVNGSAIRLQKHPDYSIARSEKHPDSSLSGWEKVQFVADSAASVMQTLETLALTLDMEEAGGYHSKMLVEGLSAADIQKFTDSKTVLDHLNKIIDTFGRKEYQKLINEMIFIPEFQDFVSLSNDGWIKKMDLIKMQVHRGHAGGLDRLTNSKNRKNEAITLDIINKVLEREMSEKEANLAQSYFTDTIGIFKDRSFALEKRSTGQDVTMVEAVPTIHRGVIRPGGYYPISTQGQTDESKVQQAIGELEAAKDNVAEQFGIKQQVNHGEFAASKMTNQDRHKSRTGTDRPLDLGADHLNSIEAIIHDLAFREVGIDLYRFYANAEFTKNVKAVIGPTAYRIMYNSTIEKVGRLDEINNNHFREQHAIIQGAVTTLKTGHAIGTLAYSASSVIIQTASLPTAALRMGKNASKHLASAGLSLFGSGENINEVLKLVNKVNPRIQFNKDGIDDTMVKSARGSLPNSHAEFFNGWTKSANAVATLRRGQDHISELGMSGMQGMDDVTKIVVTLGSIKQFIAGDVENYPLSRQKNMTDAEKFSAMSNYAQQIAKTALTSSSTTDKTAFEKISIGKLFTNYWTDGRNAVNTKFASIRKIKWAGKGTWENAKNGEYRKAAQDARKVMTESYRAVLFSMVTGLIIDSVRDKDTPVTEAWNAETPEDYQEAAKQAFNYAVMALPNAILDETPAVRDIKYGMGSKRRTDYKSVSIPLLGSWGDIATGISSLADMLDDIMELEIPHISRADYKGMGFTASYMLGGIPVNGPRKIIKAFDSELADDIGNEVGNEAQRLYDTINSFKLMFGRNPKAKEFIEDIEDVQRDILPKYGSDVKEVIPENAIEDLGEALSGNDWTKFNSDTGEAGIYQFTKERWTELVESAPVPLGLSENGRTAKDSKQQKAAMEWSIQDNTRGLIAFDIPVNLKTLYGTHKFGFDNYAEIHTANSGDKLSKVLGVGAKSDPLFKDFKTVKQVKDFIAKQVKNNNN